MLELTEQQCQHVRNHSTAPLRLTDPQTREEYVVLPAKLYEQLRRVFEEVDPSFYEFEEAEPT
jgi:hypothetical protein